MRSSLNRPSAGPTLAVSAIPEATGLACSLGLLHATNLDGGGSTTMALRGQLISHPSDTARERSLEAPF
jgi:exopolysaccharide biosynthesis protein